MKYSILYLSISVLLVLCNPMAGQNNQDQWTSIVDSFRIAYQVPGIAVGLIYPDTVHLLSTGFKKVGHSSPISTDSPFHLASNTKAITAMLAGKLVEQGLINWDTKFIDLFPELKTEILSAYYSITIEELLSHRAGILPFEDDQSREWKNMPKQFYIDQNPKLEFAKYALGLSPAKQKNQNHIYSNGGYIIAALMMEKASGYSWEQLLQKLFRDTGINGFVGFPSQQNKQSTYGHKNKGKKHLVVPPEKEYPLPAFFAPAGDLSMDITNVSKLIQLHLRGLTGQHNYLQSTTFQKLHYGFENYSLGWYNGYIGTTKDRFSYHGGSLGTFSSAILLSPDRQVGIVILINADGKGVNQLKNQLRERLWQNIQL